MQDCMKCNGENCQLFCKLRSSVWTWELREALWLLWEETAFLCVEQMGSKRTPREPQCCFFQSRPAGCHRMGNYFRGRPGTKSTLLVSIPALPFRLFASYITQFFDNREMRVLEVSIKWFTRLDALLTSLSSLLKSYKSDNGFCFRFSLSQQIKFWYKWCRMQTDLFLCYFSTNIHIFLPIISCNSFKKKKKICVVL